MTATYSQNAIIPVTPLLTLIDNTSKKEKKKKKVFFYWQTFHKFPQIIKYLKMQPY